jgi:hypothetical protein
MRHHSLVLLGALALGCNDSAKDPRVEPEAGVDPETGTDAAPADRPSDAGDTSSSAVDAGSDELPSPSSLPRPSLPRPPLQGLPAELWPPPR